jgi:hypothetical protein
MADAFAVSVQPQLYPHRQTAYIIHVVAAMPIWFPPLVNACFVRHINRFCILPEPHVAHLVLACIAHEILRAARTL